MSRKPLQLPLFFLLMLGITTLHGQAMADTISSTDTGKRTMSKFMVNLAKFVTWPDSQFADETAPYQYCLMGDNPFDDALSSAVADKQTKNRGFEVEQLALGDLDAARSCHVVFLNVPEASQATDIIDGLAGLPILTVGEVDKFAQYGGMVGFLGEGRKVALAVNQKRLEEAGLKASSRLYRASTM